MDLFLPGDLHKNTFIRFSVDPSSPDSNGIGGKTVASVNSNTGSSTMEIQYPSNVANSNGNSVSMIGGRRDFCVDRFLQNKGLFAPLQF